MFFCFIQLLEGKIHLSGSFLAQSIREPFVPVPDHYDGDLGSCQAFLPQVSLDFEMQPLSYSSNRACVAYLLSLLKGMAKEWGVNKKVSESSGLGWHQDVRGEESGKQLQIAKMEQQKVTGSDRQ
uniref:DUF4939 domain-containing protein n=1 Tax=Amphiprion percula TaxID=161767 RepID=A0A3P8TFT3_AMPPE